MVNNLQQSNPPYMPIMLNMAVFADYFLLPHVLYPVLRTNKFLVSQHLQILSGTLVATYLRNIR
jgi:hypothetical protein